MLSYIQNPAITSENSARVCLLVCYIFTKFWLCSPGHLIINETATKGKGLSSLRVSVSGSEVCSWRTQISILTCGSVYLHPQHSTHKAPFLSPGGQS